MLGDIKMTNSIRKIEDLKIKYSSCKVQNATNFKKFNSFAMNSFKSKPKDNFRNQRNYGNLISRNMPMKGNEKDIKNNNN